MFDTVISNEEEIIYYAKKLQEKGARNVLVSMAKDGAILVDENGNVSKMGVAKGTVVNSVGAGDAMVAGFLAGWLKTGDYAYALKLGTACGGATAFHSGLAKLSEIEDVFATL
jgi:1-phosphofructokinase